MAVARPAAFVCAPVGAVDYAVKEGGRGKKFTGAYPQLPNSTFDIRCDG
jgi:hypothetical protein